MESAEHIYKEIGKFVSLALSVNPNTKTEGYLEETWKLIETLPDKKQAWLSVHVP